MKTQKRNFIAKFLAIIFFIAGSTAWAADTGSTPAGTSILSSNTYVSFTNISGTTFSTQGQSVQSLVLAVYGFTNFSSLNITTTNNGVTAGQAYYFTNLYTNFANSNSIFNFTFGSNYSGVYGDLWTVDFLNASLATFGASTNVPQDQGVEVVTRITVSTNAFDGALGQFTITNALQASPDAARAASYTATNTFTYGGLSDFTDVITLVVGGPRITATKTVAVTNSAGGGVGVNDLVPGAIVYYTISYTNEGSAAGLNVEFTEFLDKNYVGLNVGTPGGSAGPTVTYSDNAGSTFVYAPSGVVDQTVDQIRFTVLTIAGSASGTLTYQVVVR